MISLNNGSKVKVKSTSTFFNERICRTKHGWVWVNAWGVEKATFPSQHEAEEAILIHIRKANTETFTYVYRRDNCMTKVDAFQKKKLWDHPGADNSRIYWGDGGIAVAVRLDNLGKAVDYLSLDDWSNRFNWSLPEGNWHYFTRVR